MTDMPCPKCHARSGDDWGQCRGSCPMPGSPHYDPSSQKDDLPPSTASQVAHNPAETLRDRFALAALPSVIAVCGRDTRDADVGYPQHCATKAYEIADAMMEARK